jgi:hypothetical protein
MKLLLGAAAMLVVAAIVALVMLMGEDPAPAQPSPFNDNIGDSALACGRTCDAEAKCARPGFSQPQCMKDCADLMAVRIAQPACAASYTKGLNCYFNLSVTCGPEQGCADEWGAAFNCTCAQPDLPAEMNTRCGK